ncbi:MAG: hypothetical protein LHV68_08175 [Elusimicrobia bacterium]|nr:hypothetical protein [Candidatus Liberimonas magnetica]
MTINEIKNAIEHLEEKELISLSEWFHKIEEDKWDKEIEVDVSKGKLDQIAEKALNTYKAGKCKEL